MSARPSFWSELKRRNVFRVALFYIVSAWLVVQVAETVLPLFEVPDGVLRGLIVLMALGSVPALIFAWVFEMTPFLFPGAKTRASLSWSKAWSTTLPSNGRWPIWNR